jgi:prepilin-type N-terminal cleavage/methylation domain-containing protein
MVARRSRAGFTLLELLLVMAIIILVGAMLAPNISNMGNYQKMTACLDGVRSACLMARSQSIEDSQPYRLAVSGGHYRVAPDSDDYFAGAVPSPDPSHPATVYEGSLPAGVTFNAAGEAPFTVPQTSSGKEATPTNWKTLSVFLPDGTATKDIDITFSIGGARARHFHLRSLTGTIAVKVEGE